jgi:hypothetical protein
MPPEKLPTVFIFVPEQWDYIIRFTKWHGTPFPTSRDLSNALKTITDHRNKFIALAKRATQLIPELVEERNQLDRCGYSNLEKETEFTAIIESMICELYSCLDGLRNTIYVIYRNVRGVQNKSTEKLFSKAVAEDYGDEFPSEFTNLLKVAYKDWFLELRRIRSELTHRRVGSCLLHDELRISYRHDALSSGTGVFIIDDIIKWINTYAEHVYVLLNAICKFWLDQLEPREVQEICGFHMGRVMLRVINVAEPVNSDSGLCFFRHFYEEEPKYACPLRDSCAAYTRVGSYSRDLVARVTKSEHHA